MDTGTILIGALLFAVLLIPFIFAFRHQRNKHKEEKQAFIAYCKTKHLNIEKPEIINELIIGFDKAQNKLVTTQKKTIEHDFEIFDLEEYKSFNVEARTSEYVKLVLSNSKKKSELLLWQKPDEVFPDKDFMSCKDIAQKWVDKLKSNA